MRARNAGVVAVTAALGLGAAFGVAACGEDREGELRIEGGTTGGAATAGTATTPTATAPTATGPETTGTETAP